MAAALTEMRAAIQATVEAEFAAEALDVRSDKLHESLGADGAVAGVYPEGEMPHSSGVIQVMRVVVQVYMRWDPQIDPQQRVDPALIEEWSWRLQRRMLDESKTSTDKVSYYNVAEITYPDDPTGNKTRFDMALEGFGPNASLTETAA